MPSDGELLTLFARRDDRTALDQLIDRHAAMVWRVCRQALRRPEDAEDAFQATFLLLVRNARSINSSESAAGWLYRVAYRTSIRARKKLAARREESLALDPLAPSEDAFPDLLKKQTTGVLLEELGKLPKRYQTTLVMRYLEGQSRRAIADQTDTTIAAVQGQLARGKQLLRRRLLRRGVSLSAAMAALGVGSRGASAAETAPAQLVAQTTANSVAMTTGGSLATSAAVVSLYRQGVRAMLTAWIAKPLGVASVAAALAALAAAANPSGVAPVGNQPPAQLTLVADVAGEPEASALGVEPGGRIAIAQTPTPENVPGAPPAETHRSPVTAAPLSDGPKLVPMRSTMRLEEAQSFAEDHPEVTIERLTKTGVNGELLATITQLVSPAEELSRRREGFEIEKRGADSRTYAYERKLEALLLEIRVAAPRNEEAIAIAKQIIETDKRLTAARAQSAQWQQRLEAIQQELAAAESKPDKDGPRISDLSGGGPERSARESEKASVNPEAAIREAPSEIDYQGTKAAPLIRSVRDEARDASSDTPEQILSRLNDAYRIFPTYEDRGSVVTRFYKQGGVRTTELAFETAFDRQSERFRYAYVDGEKRYLIAKDPENGVRTWWDVRPGVEAPTTLRSALAAAAGVSSGTSSRVPELLMPGKLGGGGLGIKNVERLADAKLNDAPMFHLKGERGGSPIELYIDQENYLLVSVLEKRQHDGFRTETVTDYMPRAGHAIADEAFRFDPPTAAEASRRRASSEEPPAAPAPPTSVGGSPADEGDLRIGSQGPAVERLQAWLNGLLKGTDAPNLVVDGDFGPATEAALRRFQETTGVPVTGEVALARSEQLSKTAEWQQQGESGGYQYGDDASLKQGQWRVYHKLSALNPRGWAVVAEVVDGEHAPILLPGDERPRPHVRYDAIEGGGMAWLVDPGHDWHDHGTGWGDYETNGGPPPVRGRAIDGRVLGPGDRPGSVVVLLRDGEGLMSHEMPGYLPSLSLAKQMLKTKPSETEAYTHTLESIANALRKDKHGPKLETIDAKWFARQAATALREGKKIEWLDPELEDQVFWRTWRETASSETSHGERLAAAMRVAAPAVPTGVGGSPPEAAGDASWRKPPGVAPDVQREDRIDPPAQSPATSERLKPSRLQRMVDQMFSRPEAPKLTPEQIATIGERLRIDDPRVTEQEAIQRMINFGIIYASTDPEMQKIPEPVRLAAALQFAESETGTQGAHWPTFVRPAEESLAPPAPPTGFGGSPRVTGRIVYSTSEPSVVAPPRPRSPASPPTPPAAPAADAEPLADIEQLLDRAEEELTKLLAIAKQAAAVRKIEGNLVEETPREIDSSFTGAVGYSEPLVSSIVRALNTAAEASSERIESYLNDASKRIDALLEQEVFTALEADTESFVAKVEEVRAATTEIIKRCVVLSQWRFAALRSVTQPNETKAVWKFDPETFDLEAALATETPTESSEPQRAGERELPE